ncbi:MAG: tRNA lysidine(34) synthetase TilS [Cyclobacteriaceae bacterium]
MLEQFLNHIEHHRLCRKEDRILLAISGGMDSMVMLDLFHSAGYSIGVAHVNFQLRGAESDADEQFIREICKTKNIPFFSTRFNTSDYAKINRLSVQMAARELRYAWFDELLESTEFSLLATAHHLNDSIETVLLNWIHGGSSDGLLGIPVKNNRTIRPLLFASRSAIEDYATQKKLSWREDSSNLTDGYPRNFLRHHVVPKLKELNPSLENTFLQGLERLRAGHALEQYAVDQLKKEYIVEEEKKTTIQKTLFKAIHHHPFILWRLVHHYHFTPAVCEDIVQAISGQPGKRFLSPTHQLIVDRTTLIVTPHDQFWNPIEIHNDQNHASLGPWDLTIETLNNPVFTDHADVAVLDKDRIQFPLVWRVWKPGDFFYPLGMEHKKKVSDFLIDSKVPNSDKPYVTVIESAGKIMWVVGYRIDNRFKITTGTQKALQLTVSPHFI